MGEQIGYENGMCIVIMNEGIETGYCEEKSVYRNQERKGSFQQLFLNRKGLRSSILLILLLTLLNILHLVMQKVSEANFNSVLRKFLNYKKKNDSDMSLW